MTSPFSQPDYTSDGGSAYPTKIDDAIAVLARGSGAAFHVQAEDPASMTVEVLAGQIFDGDDVTEVAAQTVGPIAAPAANPRIDRIVIDRATGAASRVEGTEAAEPVAPAVPAGKAPAARIALAVAQSEILDADITDERALGLLGLGGTADHQVPLGEDLVADQAEGVDTAVDDYLLVRDVSAASGAGANRKVAVSEFLRVVNLLTEEAGIDAEADFLVYYDVTAAALRKIKPVDLGSGAVDYIGSLTANNDTELDFEDIDFDTYAYYEFVIEGLETSASAQLFGRVKQGGSYIDASPPTPGPYIQTLLSGASLSNAYSANQIIMALATRTTNDLRAFRGVVRAVNHTGSASAYGAGMYGQIYYDSEAGTDHRPTNFHGAIRNTTDVQGFRFLPSAGNFAAGVIHQIGVRK